MRSIEDEFMGSVMRARGEMEYSVVALACGHENQGDEHRVAAAPGAPYAGPQRVVAATAHPRDLRAAQGQQRRLDADPFD